MGSYLRLEAGCQVVATLSSFDECSEHTTELLGFVGPSKSLGYVEKSGFDTNQNLRSRFASRTLCDREESRNLRITISFKAVCDIRRHRQATSSQLVAKSKVTEVPCLLIQSRRQPS